MGGPGFRAWLVPDLEVPVAHSYTYKVERMTEIQNPFATEILYHI